MANLQFSDLQNEVYAQTGLDSTDTTNQTNVKRWLNYVQQDLCSRYPWPFMNSRESIVTVPDYLTGTVSINTGSQTVTGSGTTFTATHGNGNYFIQFLGANDWYKVTAYNSATSLTVEQPYQPTTNAVNVTYTLRQIFYSLSSNLDRVVDIRNWNTPLKLFHTDPRLIDDLRPNPESTNAPYGYVTWMIDSSGNIQISPYPFPSDARLFEIRSIKRPVDMSGSTDLPTIPNKYAHILAFGATAVGYAFLRKWDGADAWSKKFDARVQAMKSEYRMSEDNQHMFRSIDSVQRSKWLSFPEQYPTINSG